MNRRTALFSSLALGGLLARTGLGQQSGRTRAAEQPEPEFRPDPADSQSAPADFSRPGTKWRIFNISRYTDLPHAEETERPESSMVDWILRRTGSEAWHGADLAVLNATPKELRIYHNLKMLEQVTDVVKRFIDSVFDMLTLRVRIVVAADPKWRYAVYSQLEPKAAGPMGQQVWTIDLGTAEMALAQMGIAQNFRKIYDRRHKLVNGQTLYVKSSNSLDYYSGLDRASSASLGYEPKVSKLEEGVEIRLSPLLNFDGTAIDLAIDLKASALQKLHTTKVIAPRKIGPAEMNVDIPQFAASRMNQTIANWPLDRTLAISAGILPGVLEEEGGFMANLRLPGVSPNATELLILLDVSTNLGNGRSSDDPEEEASDEPVARRPSRPARRPSAAESDEPAEGDDLSPEPSASGFRAVDGSKKKAEPAEPEAEELDPEPEPQ